MKHTPVTVSLCIVLVALFNQCRVFHKKHSDAGTFTTLPSGLMYKIAKHGIGKRNPAAGDHVEINIHIHSGDSVMFDSRKMNNDEPVPLPISAPKYKGDVMEGFLLMVEGDSAVFRVNADSLKKSGAQVPPWAKPGDFIEYDVALISVRTDSEEKADQAMKTEKQKAVDDKILQDHFAKKGIKPLKTASGLYYTIEKEGSGEPIQKGTSVSVNYTGMFLDGRKFDSNTDSAFQHVTPFDLEVGVGHVIKGWDEGLQLLKKGSKATFYIPSPLAYGSMSRQGLPANSILVFTVEIINAASPEQKKAEREEKQKASEEHAVKQNEIDEKVLTEYFARNKINATRTPSGLYYVMTQKGLGNNAKPGERITMNYTGRTLDGPEFDSNTDPKFGHVSPFVFTLGQGMVIKGWEEGVQLLKLGSKATFYIPSSLAYGAAGAGASIPPNAILVFDVEVTGINRK